MLSGFGILTAQARPGLSPPLSGGYSTPSGIAVTRTISNVTYSRGLRGLLKKLDTQRGIYLSSGYEFPGRYSRWDIASVCAAARDHRAWARIKFRPLNARGEMLNKILRPVQRASALGKVFQRKRRAVRQAEASAAVVPRGRAQQAALGVLHPARADRGVPHPPASRLALVGAFGYDLLFQFDPITLKLPRHDVKDLHLFFCDDIYFMDRKKERIERYQYDFERAEFSTLAGAGPRPAAPVPRARRRETRRSQRPHAGRVHGEGRNRARRHAARRLLRSGAAPDLPRALFRPSPSELFERIQHASPSPYEFFLQLGDEQLMGASPEMFVRVEGRPRRDLPHLRHRAAHRRSAARRRQHPRAAQLDQGRIRADHVHRRGPQRQVARLRARLGEGDRAPADRILCRRLPHGGSRRRNAGRGLRFARRVSHPHVGRHHDRRAEEGRPRRPSRTSKRTRAAGMAAPWA